jgi:hypothetical protein
MVAHANAGTAVTSGRAVAPLTFPWTPQLAREFPGCQAHVRGVASAFVVERENGRMQRLPFDLVWKWTHHPRADYPAVWVRGMCR